MKLLVSLKETKIPTGKTSISFHYLYIKIECGSAQSSLKTVFSLASALAFHYLCRMKTELKENGGLPAHILWTLAIVAGVSVANLYYNQPLLNVIRHELGVSEFKTNLIAMITQVGYAIGLLFIVPLGDLYQRKRLS